MKFNLCGIILHVCGFGVHNENKNNRKVVLKKNNNKWPHETYPLLTLEGVVNDITA